MHPTTERHDQIGLRVASGLGPATGFFIVVVEIAALVLGRVT